MSSMDPVTLHGRVYAIRQQGVPVWTYFIRVGAGKPGERTHHADRSWPTEADCREVMKEQIAWLGKDPRCRALKPVPENWKNAIEGCRFGTVEGRCSAMPETGYEFCARHRQLKCRCGIQAVEECGHDFRCQELLCEQHDCAIAGH